MIKLIVPSADHEKAAIDFADEVMRADGDGIHGSSDLYTTKPYSIWLDNVTKSAAGIALPGLSPAAIYFAVDNKEDRIVGIINIRYELDSEFMLKYGGHIGYTVRPVERRKGYATKMLSFALDICNQLGMDKVLLTCDPENTASCKVIEMCGGKMENEIPFEDTQERVRRYWIEI